MAAEYLDIEGGMLYCDVWTTLTAMAMDTTW